MNYIGWTGIQVNHNRFWSQLLIELRLLSNPARNTLLYNEIDTIHKLATHKEKDILALHGMDKASLPALHQALADKGLEFQNKTEP